jgi:protease-4
MKRMILGIFIGLLLALGLLVGGIWGLVRLAGRGELEVPAQALLVLDWSGSLPGHQISPMDANLGTPVTLSRVTEAIRQAASRPEIQALLIDRHLELPREYLSELDAAVAEFRRQGKPVLAHSELGIGTSYLAACLADEVALSPSVSGGLVLPGPRVSLTYMADGLAKLGIKVHVLHQGEAKGFGEQYARQEMSAPVRQNLGGLVDDLLAEELRWVGSRRGVDAALLHAELVRPERLWLTPQEAVELGLADTLLSRPAWEDRLEERFPGARRLSLSSWISSRRMMPTPGRDLTPDVDNHIAVLWAEGSIVPGISESAQVQIQSRAMIEAIRALAEADAVQAVVLRVESPGGSALAAEEIYQELVKLGERKPLWVSAGPMAASGGYYLAVPGRQLWISPFSVVGSIGVVGLLPDLSAGAKRLGLNPQVVAPLPAARLGNLGHPVEAATLAAMESRMALIYGEFRSRVLAHRPFSEEQLAPLAGGRVWAGRRAVELGLADHLGNLQDCLGSLQAELGGRDLPVRHYPRQKSLLTLLMEGSLRPRDLLPGAALGPAVQALGGGDLVSVLEREPARLADPRWSLRAELPLRLE